MRRNFGDNDKYNLRRHLSTLFCMSSILRKNRNDSKCISSVVLSHNVVMIIFHVIWKYDYVSINSNVALGYYYYVNITWTFISIEYHNLSSILTEVTVQSNV